MKYQLVIFDCDGVLVDSEPIVSRVESQFLEQFDLHFTPDEICDLFKGKQTTDVIERVEELTGAPLRSDWPYDLGMAVARAFREELQPVPGIQKVLEHLRAQRVPVCVATQSPFQRMKFSLEVTGLTQYFDGNLFNAAMVPKGKPAPDLYLFAAEQMGTAPSNCAVVEDSFTGIKAGLAAGMRVFAYVEPDERSKAEEMGCEVVAEMEALIRLLE